MKDQSTINRPVIEGSMTLEEKLQAIDNLMSEIHIENALRSVQGIAPVDPMSLLVCEGCQ